MRLTKEQVEKISRRILDGLKAKELIMLKSGEEEVSVKIRDVFLADLRAEDALDREVEVILESHSSAIDTQRLDYRKMFNMIKSKLARERGLTL